MKPRLYAMSAWTALLAVAAFVMAWDPQIAIAVLFLPVLAFVPLALGLVIWSVVGVVRLWRSVRWWSLCPLALFCVSFSVAGAAGTFGFHLRLERFKRHLPEYEELVGVIRRNDITELRKRDIKIATNDPDYMSLDLPDTLHHLGWGVRVRRGGNEGLTVVFVYAGGFGHHYADYVYREDGDFRKVLDKVQMHVQQAINTNWCAASG